jgi:diphthine-ammonia ligase
MSKSLNVVALISGGKDSLYTLLHCIQNGHKVVALANLYPSLPDGTDPAATENEDINSFMYQTVGHNVIPLYAEALQLPLYRQQIMGTSKQTGRYYDPSLNASSADETEDLLPLLENVKMHHPEVNAVCSGAILSTYQRTRIESVAVRLGLTSLAYLWQYPSLPPPSSRQDSLTGLLEDMSAVGCDSRIIKVASGGMPAGLLGANVADMRTMKRIIANMAPYFENDEPALRGAVLGEGGEFETLALDGPRSVWKKKIELTEEDSSVVNEEGGVHWLKLGQARTVQHNAQAEHKTSTDIVHVPNTFDPQFEYIAAMHSKVPDSVANASQSLNEISTGTTLLYNSFEGTSIKSFESHTLGIVNIAAPNVLGNAVQQMEHIVSCLENVLHRISIANNIKPPLSSASVVSTTLLIKSMTSFLAVNNSYARLFPYGLPNPPARVTIACDLPPNILVSLSCIISLLPRNTRRGLHVQSQSYWAPANIGPYSQAVCVPFTPDDKDHREFVYAAGQIPLVPASMEILHAPFVDQALLALQHLWRIGQERGVDLWTWGVAFLPRLDEVESKQLHQLATKIWRQAHQTTVYGKSALGYVEDGDEDSESGPDAWDLKMGTGRVTPSVGKHRHVLPNSTVFANELDGLWIPPIVVAEVEELPRAAPIEWHSHGLGGLPKRPSGTPAVFVGFWEFPWGRVSVCSYQHTSKLSDRDVLYEEDQPTSQKERRDHHFVTIQVLQAQMAGERIKVPSISEVLEYVLPARSGLPSDIKADGEEKVGFATRIGDGRFTYVHGAAYIAGYHGEAAFADLGGLESIPSITLVPCRRLWGRCYRTRVSGLHDQEEEDMDLSMALTVRVDTIADRGLGSSAIR